MNVLPFQTISNGPCDLHLAGLWGPPHVVVLVPLCVSGGNRTRHSRKLSPVQLLSPCIRQLVSCPNIFDRGLSSHVKTIAARIDGFGYPTASKERPECMNGMPAGWPKFVMSITGL